jgi:hypothetical protein
MKGKLRAVGLNESLGFGEVTQLASLLPAIYLGLAL